MKKIIAVVLAAVMLFSICVTGFAAQKDVTPVIVVGGVGCRGYYMDAGTENEVSVFPPTVDVKYIVIQVLTGIAKTILTGNLDFTSQMAANILESVFDGFMCNADGDSKYENVGSIYYPLSIDNYDFDFENDVPEAAIAGTAAKAVGAENTYFYNYDWRLDPLANADRLNETVENAKAKAGSDKVTLIPCSMGGVQTLSYLAKYGSDSVEKIIFMSSAHKGLYFVSELFSGNLQLSQKDIFKYLSDFLNLGDENTDNLFDFLCAYLGNAWYLKPVFSFLDKFAKDISNETVYDSLRRVFGSMPGMWAFVRSEYYDGARAFMTTDKTSAALLSKIDNYHKTVGSVNDSILTSAAEKGTAICICSHYGRGSIPVTPKACIEGDYLIETASTSNGVTIADAGKYLPDGYTQAKECGGHNHVSADGKADASTCLFPDSTWLLKNVGHVGCNYGSDYADMLLWMLETEGQPTVFDNEKYPQFLKASMDENKLEPITADSKVTLKNGFKAFINYITEVI